MSNKDALLEIETMAADHYRRMWQFQTDQAHHAQRMLMKACQALQITPSPRRPGDTVFYGFWTERDILARIEELSGGQRRSAVITRLIIDDERVFTFDDKPRYARTPEDAEPAIFGQPWDEIWWDHDVFNAQGSATSTEALANETVANRQNVHVGRMIVHSNNPAGGDALVKILSPYWPVARLVWP